MMKRSQCGAVTAPRSLLYRRMHDAASVCIRSRWAKTVVFELSLIPVIAMLWLTGNQNPASAGAFVTRHTGDWTLAFLILTLAITPLRRFLELPDLIRFRRTLGLFAFVYGCLHVAAWHLFNHGHTVQIGFLIIWSLRIGFLGFALMIPLAVTSTDRWVRWLGGKRWRALHSWVYVSVIAGIVHYWLLPGVATWKVLAFSATAALLFILRIRTSISRARGANHEQPDSLKPSLHHRNTSVAQNE